MHVFCLDKAGATLSFMLKTALRSSCVAAGLENIEIDGGGIDEVPAREIHEYCIDALVRRSFKPDANEVPKTLGSLLWPQFITLVVCTSASQEERAKELLGSKTEVLVVEILEPQNNLGQEYQRCADAVLAAIPVVLEKISQMTETTTLAAIQA